MNNGEHSKAPCEAAPVERLIAVARKAEEMFRNFAGEDPGGCLTAGSPHAEACEIADEIRDAVEACERKGTSNQKSV